MYTQKMNLFLTLDFENIENKSCDDFSYFASRIVQEI